MATAYTTSLRLAQPVTGELNGTWGDVVNTQITAMVEQGLAGYLSIAIAGNTTLTASNGVSDQARNMMLKFTGTLAAGANITVPTVSKLYFIDNATTGGFAITVKTSAGSGVAVPAGFKRIVYCDGTNVVDAVTDLPTGATVNGVTIASTTAVSSSITAERSATRTLTNATLDVTNCKIGALSGLLKAATGTPAAAVAGTDYQAPLVANTDYATPALTVAKDSGTGAAALPSGTTAQRPSNGAGKLRFNSDLGKAEVNNGTTWGSVGGGATGGGTDDVFYENAQTVSVDYTLTSGKNAMSAGPITINSGVTVTVPSGSTWTVV